MTKKFTLYTSLNTRKHPSLVFKQLPFYHNRHVMTEPFSMTCQLKRKKLHWEYRKWKPVLFLMRYGKTVVVFIVTGRNAKFPCWYLPHQIRYISKFFSSLKDPVSLTLFKPSASHFLISGTTDTMSPRVKVMKGTELVVRKKIWFQL